MNIKNKIRLFFHKYNLDNIFLFFNNDIDLETKTTILSEEEILSNPLASLCQHPFYSIIDISFVNQKIVISLESIITLTILHDCIQNIYNRTSDYIFTFDITRSYKIDKLVIDVEIQFSTTQQAYKYLLLLLTDLNLELIESVTVEPKNIYEHDDLLKYFNSYQVNYESYIRYLDSSKTKPQIKYIIDVLHNHNDMIKNIRDLIH
jgi:hypothetical protein